jgi:hypothetical protein
VPHRVDDLIFTPFVVPVKTRFGYDKGRQMLSM